MGLDMIAFATNDKDLTTGSNLKMPELYIEITTWRKHPDLHGWKNYILLNVVL